MGETEREIVGRDWPWREIHLPYPVANLPVPVVIWAGPEEQLMVAIKNATYVGKGPGIPTTAVPAYKAGDPYYPKGSLGVLEAEADPAAQPAKPTATKESPK